MLISTSTCPLCQREIAGNETRCPHCNSIIQITLAPPRFSRSTLVEGLIYPVLQGSRRQIGINKGSGYDFYVLGLGYLNYEMPDEGLELWNHAADLLPTQSSIHFEVAMISYVHGKYEDGLREIERAVELEPNNVDFQELRRTLSEAIGPVGSDTRSSIGRWMVSYEQNPTLPGAPQALTKFIAAHKARLHEPIAYLLRPSDPKDAERLRLLNSSPSGPDPQGENAPTPPNPLNAQRLELIRKVAPDRATLLEQIHAEQVSLHNVAANEYAASQRLLQERQNAQVAAWQEQVKAIESDLAAMTRLCLTLINEEERLDHVLDAHKTAMEAREHDESQRVIQEDNLPGNKKAPPPIQPLEQRYLFSWGRYLLGLPVGKRGDRVALTVTDKQTIVYHPDSTSRWKRVIATAKIVEVAAATVDLADGSQEALRITFLDDEAVLKHLFLVDLEESIAAAVRRIEAARTYRPLAAAARPQ